MLRWLRSSLRGEVSVADLAARRAAGGAAYALIEEAAEAVGDDRGTRLFRLCAWNAYALQTIVDRLLDVDAAEDPATAGYVPRSTLSFAAACLDEVPYWLREARVLRSDGSARIRVGLPAKLPPWFHDEPTRTIELHGLRSAYDALGARVQSDLQAFTGPEAPVLRHVCATMTSSAEYADALSLRTAGPVDRGEARWRLLDALRCAYTLGQLLAFPPLAEVARVQEERAAELPPGAESSWLQIGPGCPVLDCEGVRVGRVARVLGDRNTGEFEGLEVDADVVRPSVTVPPTAIASIGVGEIRLSVRRERLG